MRNAVEDAMFDAGTAKEFLLDLRGGELYCMALKRPDPAEPPVDDGQLPF